MSDAKTIGRQRRDFTKGSLLNKIFWHLIPLLLSNFLQLLFTTMDIFTVTHFGGGNISSGAIGATNSLINLILCVFWGLTAGISVVLGNARGAGDYEKMTRTMGTSVVIMGIASIIVLFCGVFASKPLLIALGTGDEFIEKSSAYLTIYFIGAPFNLLYNTGASFFRSTGDTRRPLVAVAVSGVVNIGLNFLLVRSLDVVGVAIATIASQCVAMVIIFAYLMCDKRLSRNFKFSYIRLHKEESLDVLKHGVLSGLQALIFNFTNVNIQKCFNELGEAAVIGKAASSNVEGYQYALLNSISQTCMVAVSQNYGAKDKKRTIQSFIVCVLLELILVTVFDVIIFALNGPILSLFINSNEPNAKAARKVAVTSLMIMGFPYAICGIAECFTSFLRGMKKPVVPTIVSLACIVGIRMIFIWFLFKIEFFHNYTWLYLTYPISWTLCCLVYIPIVLKVKKTTLDGLDLKNEYTAIT